MAGNRRDTLRSAGSAFHTDVHKDGIERPEYPPRGVFKNRRQDFNGCVLVHLAPAFARAARSASAEPDILRRRERTTFACGSTHLKTGGSP